MQPIFVSGDLIRRCSGGLCQFFLAQFGIFTGECQFSANDPIPQFAILTFRNVTLVLRGTDSLRIPEMANGHAQVIGDHFQLR